jgi:hypothetical protein
MTKTPEIRHLVLRDMVDYFKGCGFPATEANKRAEKLMELVDREAAKFAPAGTKEPYPPNTMCDCGELIHPDQPHVFAEADGTLWHGNPDGGGHRSDYSRLT